MSLEVVYINNIHNEVFIGMYHIYDKYLSRISEEREKAREYKIDIVCDTRARIHVIIPESFDGDILTIYGRVELLEIRCTRLIAINLGGTCNSVVIANYEDIRFDRDYHIFNCIDEYNENAKFPILNRMPMNKRIKWRVSRIVQQWLLARKKKNKMILG